MRGLFFIIFLGLGTAAQGKLVDYPAAETESNSITCGSQIALPEFKNDVSSFADYMLRKNHYSYNSKQIKNALCSNPKTLSSAQAKNYLIQNSHNTKINTQLFGMDLSDDPELIELLKKLVEVEKNVVPWKALKQKQFKLPKGCESAVCAAEEIFGKDKGPKLLYALKKYGVNLSHLRRKDTDAWNGQEVDLILEALDDLPQSLVPFKDNLRLVRNTRGATPGGNYANAQIMVFDSFEEKSKYEKMGTIIHELGHRVGEIGKVEETPEWRELSKWEESNEQWTPMKDSFVGMYAKTNPFEDFAETFVAYRYNPETLKEVAPKKYEFMKYYVFQGLEYDSSENCADTNTLTHSLNAKADQEEYLSIAVCRREAQAILQGLSSASRMRMCAQRASLNISEIELPKEINKNIVHYNIQNTGRNYAPNANFEVDLEVSYNKLFEELSAKMQAGETDCRQIRDYSRKRDKRYSAQAFLSSSFTFSPRSDINEYSISACEMFVELEDLSNTEKLRNSFKKVVPTLNSEK